jgi:Spy/CpxP family protein refolding chaperone
MKSIAYLAFAMAMAVALLPASQAWAQPMAHMKGAPGHDRGQGGPMSTGLTQDQQQTMQKIMNAHKPAFTRLNQRLWAKGIQLQAALTEDKIDESRVKALTGEINRFHADLFNEQVAMQVELAKAGLAYYTMRGHGMMGMGMMGSQAGGACPMMGGDGDPHGGGGPED